ncbi:hypothetical protein BTUL_0003g00470 [Botrytis tulipae]|uniref:Uncharacterized protein n=1 Tax=Botrytis tulipae TaxID=87230 RepID=A0A4Z1FA15_9HELO|nr:hypothetical protein BTUL_0003g00470 [Botrytis tulipae]
MKLGFHMCTGRWVDMYPKIAINSNSTQCVLRTVLIDRVSVNNSPRKELQYGLDNSARTPMERRLLFFYRLSLETTMLDVPISADDLLQREFDSVEQLCPVTPLWCMSYGDSSEK